MPAARRPICLVPMADAPAEARQALVAIDVLAGFRPGDVALTRVSPVFTVGLRFRQASG